ncbi:MAG: hypothetical protein ABH847_05310 [Candidatus Omnitrophota bacterium]
MYKVICRILLAFFFLSFVLGCATVQLKGKEKLEAKDWLHAGDLALMADDNDTAQYFYELVIEKYPNTYYARKAKKGLTWVNLRRSCVGKTIQKGKDFVEPIF